MSVLCFLKRMTQVHYQPNSLFPIVLQELLCDNKSIGKVINKRCTFKTIFPNATLVSDADILAEARRLLLEMDEICRPTIEHIKGHQDKNKSYEELPLRAQLNIDADALADQFLTDNPDIDHTRVPILPTTGSQVELFEGTCTYSLKKSLHHAAHAPALMHHLQHRHSWTQEIFDDIDWTALGRALRRHDQHRQMFVKYLNDILPLGQRLHKQDIKYPESCPSCTAPVESRQHFLYCPAESRAKWRKACYQNIHKYLDTHNTSPPLHNLFLSAIKAILDSPHNILDRIDQPSSLQHVVTAQDDIGWNHLLKGRISKQFAIEQNNYLGTDATGKKNGTSWLVGLIDTIFKQIWDLWDMRNKDRHGHDLQSKAQAQAAQAVRELQLFYDTHQPKAPDHLQWIFETPFEERMQWKTYAIRQWLNSWDPVLRESYSTELETG